MIQMCLSKRLARFSTGNLRTTSSTQKWPRIPTTTLIMHQEWNAGLWILKKVNLKSAYTNGGFLLACASPRERKWCPPRFHQNSRKPLFLSNQIKGGLQKTVLCLKQEDNIPLTTSIYWVFLRVGGNQTLFWIIATTCSIPL